jgi:RimJ/RimL family protein N-acetyltransferase
MVSPSLSVRELEAKDVPALSEMLTSASKEYLRYFVPFAFDEQSIRAMLESVIEDVYTGLWYDDELAGFFMLRGWDAGYSIPSYGVFIREAFAGRGLSTMTLHMALSLCKRRGARTVMLKVHPDNVVAKKTYEKFGFVAAGHDPKINNIIYHYDVL